MAFCQPLRNGCDGFSTEVVDAEVCDVGGKVAVFGLWFGRIHRQANEVKGGAGTQAAHGTAGQPAALPGFARFHGQAAVALGFAGVGPSVEAGIVVAFEERSILPPHRLGTGDGEGDALLGFVIVANRGETVAGQPLVLPESEDGVLVFLRVGSVVTDALPAIGGFRNDVLRNTLAVGKEPQAMAGRGFDIFFDTPTEAFFGQEPRDEGVV